MLHFMLFSGLGLICKIIKTQEGKVVPTDYLFRRKQTNIRGFWQSFCIKIITPEILKQVFLHDGVFSRRLQPYCTDAAHHMIHRAAQLTFVFKKNKIQIYLS